MLKKILSSIFSIGQWETVYFTNKLEQSYEIQYKLMNNNIRFKTNIIDNNLRGRTRSGGIGIAGNVNNYYEILVKKDDVYKANEITHSK